MDNKGFNRRDFLKAGAFAGASLVAASALGACAPKTDEPASVGGDASSITWDKETEIVVVGFGAAGSAATLEATKAGAKVVLLEKTAAGGGATRLSAGIVYMGGGTELQKTLGFADTRDDMYNYLLAAAGPHANEELIGIYCDNSVDLFNWCLENGITFSEEFAPGKYVVTPEGTGLQWSGNERGYEYTPLATPNPRGHTPGTSGQAVFDPLGQKVESSGAEIIYDATLTALVKDDTGRVVGVQSTIDGETVAIKASKAVIITAGGWLLNTEMMATYLPRYIDAANKIGSPVDMGEGIKAAQAIGADLRNMGLAMCSVPVYAYGEAITSCILVNCYGQRVVAEDCYAAWTGKAVVPTGGAAWVIADIKSSGSVYDPFIGRDAEPFAQADTIEELATKLGIEPHVLANTTALYNASVSAGEDYEFHKAPEYLATIDSPPFSAYDLNINVAASFMPLGGLKINKDAQVIAAQTDKPIPGLYAAGRSTCAIYGDYMGSGTSIGESLTFGRIAGQNAAAQ